MRDRADSGYYVLLSDLSQDTPSKAEPRQRLRAQYLNIRNNLVKPNYDALQLIVTHAQGMTKSTAQCIVALLADMVEAYRHVAFSDRCRGRGGLYATGSCAISRVHGRPWKRMTACQLPCAARVIDMVENAAGELTTA